ncbi:FHA-domain-containing proteins [Gulosibacter sp. 10]|nr:FHA-domain-containing proteins [Gulosibacter sp. 10]
MIQDDYTSTRHARLLNWDGAWMLQDLDSTNGTFINGERVTQPVELRRGVSVRIGTTTFELR